MSLFSKIFQTFFSKIIIALLSFIISIIVVKLVGAEGQGSIATYITLFLLISSISFISLGSGTIYYVNKEKNINNYFSSIFFLNILILFFLLSTFFYFKPLIIINYPELNNGSYLILGTILLVTFNLAKVSAAYSRAMHNSLKFNGAIISEKMLYLFTILFFYFASIEVSFYEILFSLVIASLIIHSYVIFSYATHIRFRFIALKYIRKLFKFSLKGHLGVIIQKLNLKFDILLLAYLFSFELVGYYSISLLFAQTILYVPDSIAIFLYPKISKSNDLKFSLNTTLQINRISTFVIFVIAIILAIFSELLITYIYGFNFVKSVLPLLILLIGSIFFSTVKIITKLSTGIGFPLVGTKISIVGIVFNIPLLILLVPRFDIIGAAIASAISYMIMFFASIYWLYLKDSSFSFSRILLINKTDIKLLSNHLNKILNII